MLYIDYIYIYNIIFLYIFETVFLCVCKIQIHNNLSQKFPNFFKTLKRSLVSSLYPNLQKYIRNDFD